MTHEFKKIVQQAFLNQQQGVKNVLATVVALKGSSYRKPGVRMLLSSEGKMIGAVSGGCVEKEVLRKAQSVFVNEKPKVMSYDGRYRLGCEGVLYILLEPFFVSKKIIAVFTKELQLRRSFSISSYFKKMDEAIGNFGSIIQFKDGKQFSFSANKIDENELVFSQKLQPLFRLVILGGGHDAVKLCAQASQLGWWVTVITSAKEPKESSFFPTATNVIAQAPELMDFSNIDQHTAVVIMNHNFTYDLRWLIKLQNYNPVYIGVLGAAKRREKLRNELFEFSPMVSDAFLEKIHTPAGLHIGAETPEEIAVSILAEILSVARKKEVFPLKKIVGKIHS